jgi:hypothetical protein
MNDNKKFVADVKAFRDLSAEKMLAVARQSIQDVMREAQSPVAQGGSMPVDTGFLRNSLVSSVEGGSGAKGGDSYTLAIAQLQLGDVIEFAWTADYAIPRHYMVGVGQGGGLWRDRAAQKWPTYVAANVQRAQ